MAVRKKLQGFGCFCLGKSHGSRGWGESAPVTAGGGTFEGKVLPHSPAPERIPALNIPWQFSGAERKVSSYTEPAPSSHKGYFSLAGVLALFKKKYICNFSNLLKPTRKVDFLAFLLQACVAVRASIALSFEPHSYLAMFQRTPRILWQSQGLFAARGCGGVVCAHACATPEGFHMLKATPLKSCFAQLWPCKSVLLQNHLRESRWMLSVQAALCLAGP